ncbi:MAG: hypothetical protein ACYTKD_00315 [Planctomycetota bacterium]|jgi:hypothetical protein
MLRGIVRGVAAASVALVAGCGGMLRADIVVELDKDLVADPARIPSIQVNLVGVNTSELPQWKGYAVSEYWSPGDKLRASADKYEMRFSQSRPTSQKLERTDSMFDEWQAKTASHLFVLADLPGVPEPKPGAVDPRRLVLPLDSKAWKLREGRIVITVRSKQMLCTPAPVGDM